MLNKNFIKRKIDLIQNELTYLVPLKDYTFEELSKDFMNQAGVERILERTINRAIDINQHLIAELADLKTEPPLDYKGTFLRLIDLGIYDKDFAENISRSVGIRNKLAHEYDKIDKEKIYTSVHDCLEDYTKYCEYILNFLNNLTE
ncbi:MAG: DUF86 domain-containing protein [Parcubacteria group bacterium]